MSDLFDPSVEMTLTGVRRMLQDFTTLEGCDVSRARYVITTRNAFASLTMNGLIHDGPFGSGAIVGVQAEGRFQLRHDPGTPWEMQPGGWQTVAHLDLDRTTGAMRGHGWGDEAPDLSILGEVHEVQRAAPGWPSFPSN